MSIISCANCEWQRQHHIEVSLEPHLTKLQPKWAEKLVYDRGWTNIRKKYIQRRRRKPLPVENLNEVLTSFGDARCLTVIDNFEAIDLPEITGPVIIRNLEIAIAKKWWRKVRPYPLPIPYVAVISATFVTFKV